MTREELRDDVAHLLLAGGEVSAVADAILRLVAEACSSRLRNPPPDEDYSWYGEALDSAADDLEATFLPPEARDGEAD